MSAQSLNAWTVVFAASDLDTSASDLKAPTNHTLTRVPYSSISYNYINSLDLRTLSTNHASASSIIAGLLFVPDLPPNDPCSNLSSQYVPANVTRLADFPTTTYDTVAFAPWINANCTRSYLAAAQWGGTQAFLFYLAGNDDGNTPPDPTDEVWDLQDNGAWKKHNPWPVYAIPGLSGQQLMQASSEYSGNMSQVPNGQQLAGYYNSSDYVRLFMAIDTASGGSNLPSIWLFLLVVLGVLLSGMGFTSLVMHYIQRHRRTLLRRRVANGEIDLETLGIKRLTVPQDVLDGMPLYIYGTGAPVSAAKVQAKESSASSLPPSGKLSSSADSSRPGSPVFTSNRIRPNPASNKRTSFRPTPLQQPTCAICLDDFIPASPDPKLQEPPASTIRELPCHHIFHPECVDAFLLNNSSLCPMCKKSALPAGYCPAVITNAMVRRERIIRRIQARRATVLSIHPAELRRRNDEDLYVDLRALQGRRAFSGAGLAWLNGRVRDDRRISSAPAAPSTSSYPMTELPPPVPSGSTSPAPPPASPNRREWARQRAVAMMSRGATVPPPIIRDPDEAEAEAPRWRKALRGVFPAVGSGGGGGGGEGPSTVVR